MKKLLSSLLFIGFISTSCTTSSPSDSNPSSSPSPANASPSGSPQASSSPVSSPAASPSPSASAPAQTANNQGCANLSLTVGQQVSGKEFFSQACFTPKVGTKWVYTTLGKDVSTEITAKNGDGTYTVTVSSDAGTKTVTSSNPSGNTENSDDIALTYEGTESVTVPAGTYTTFKASGTQTKSGATSKYTYWLAKEAGTVKVVVEITNPIAYKTETVLKEFKN
jgi:hypothetical protein